MENKLDALAFSAAANEVFNKTRELEEWQDRAIKAESEVVNLEQTVEGLEIQVENLQEQVYSYREEVGELKDQLSDMAYERNRR